MQIQDSSQLQQSIKVMQYESETAYKRNNFRNQIRRNEIQSLFARQRALLLNKFQLKEKIDPSDYSTQLTTIFNDVVEARAKDKYPTFIQNKRNQYPVEWFHPYLTRDVGLDLLNMATKVLGQYYYYTDRKIPTLTTLNLILDLIKESDDQVISNCLYIISNLLHDYKQIKITLVAQFNFVDLVNCKMVQYHNNERLIKQLLKIIYNLLNLSKQYTQYQKFFEPAINFIKSGTYTHQINLLATYNFYQILRLFPDRTDFHKMILQEFLIQKMICWLEDPHYADRRFSYIIFDTIYMCRDQIKAKTVKDTVMPYIMGMRTLDFEYGARSTTYTSQKIKHKAYNYLLWLAQQKSEILLPLLSFYNFKYMKQFLEELKQLTAPKTAEFLAKILYRMCLNLKDEEAFIIEVRDQITRTIEELNDFKFDLQTYFGNYKTQLGGIDEQL